MTNSIPQIKLNLNSINPIVKSTGIVNEKLYVRRIAKEIMQIKKQNFKPQFIINFVNLSKFLKLLKIFFNIIITYINNSIYRCEHQWKFVPIEDEIQKFFMRNFTKNFEKVKNVFVFEE